MTQTEYKKLVAELGHEPEYVYGIQRRIKFFDPENKKVFGCRKLKKKDFNWSEWDVSLDTLSAKSNFDLNTQIEWLKKKQTADAEYIEICKKEDGVWFETEYRIVRHPNPFKTEVVDINTIS